MGYITTSEKKYAIILSVVIISTTNIKKLIKEINRKYYFDIQVDINTYNEIY